MSSKKVVCRNVLEIPKGTIGNNIIIQKNGVIKINTRANSNKKKKGI